MSRKLVCTAGLAICLAIRCLAAGSVPIDFSTTNATALNLGFAGFTTELLGTGIEYGDTNMQRLAANLSPGWLLFPAGTTGDAFSWSTGLTVQSWVDTIGLKGNPIASNLAQVTYLALQGKGGVWFTNFATLAGKVGGAKIIVCVNGFTDTAASAGAFAQFASSNHIPVAVWELCNEPYLFKGPSNFFTNGADYAVKMKPYRDAIKAVDSNAVVAVFFSDPALTNTAWDKSLAGYTNRYWDAVVYHHYPRWPTNSSFSDLMAMDNGVLLSNTSTFVTGYLVPNNNSNVTFLLTEFDPEMGNGNGIQNPPTSTLYGGIFAAEYLMRLSTVPQVTYAGSYQLVNGSGVDTTNQFWNTVTKAASNGYATNTVGLPFGYYLSAQGSAEAVAYWALNRSTAVYPTTVGTNGPTVPINTNGSASMPAIYAQAYRGGNGKRYVLVTNKGSNAVPVQVSQDGSVLTNQLLMTFVSGADPGITNSNPAFNNIFIQTNLTTNPITIPEFSVARFEWTALNIPSPTLEISSAPQVYTLQWSGSPNSIYSVQGASAFLDAWTTLGRVSSAQTNFTFTDYSAEPIRFYRLAVP